MSTVYISGPMTGLPGLNFGAFAQAEKDLKERGHTVVNPARHGAPTAGQTYEDLLRASIRDLLDCDAICLLDGWWRSKGASVESEIARALGMRIMNHPFKECPRSDDDPRR